MLVQRLCCNHVSTDHNPLSFHPGYQQLVQLTKGCAPAAFGTSRSEAGPLPGVWGSCAGPAGVCVWAGGSLAGLYLVQHRGL